MSAPRAKPTPNLATRPVRRRRQDRELRVEKCRCGRHHFAGYEACVVCQVADGTIAVRRVA